MESSFLNKVVTRQKSQKKSQKWAQNYDFRVLTKILFIHMYFLHKYENNNGLLNFYKNQTSEKNLVLELWFENLKKMLTNI